MSSVPHMVELAVFCSTGCGPGYDTVFSVVLMCSVQRSDAGCKSLFSSCLNPLTCARSTRDIWNTLTNTCTTTRVLVYFINAFVEMLLFS